MPSSDAEPNTGPFGLEGPIAQNQSWSDKQARKPSRHARLTFKRRWSCQPALKPRQPALPAADLEQAEWSIAAGPKRHRSRLRGIDKQAAKAREGRRGQAAKRGIIHSHLIVMNGIIRLLVTIRFLTTGEACAEVLEATGGVADPGCRPLLQLASLSHSAHLPTRRR